MPGLGTTMTLRELALAQGIDKNDPIVEMLSKSMIEIGRAHV